ncbi:hypothetical protein [Sphingomonas sp. GC_Shp_3]|uniref:hypothetical protein n=1 Tax=Sphingomonas sp. GC_Shp_3 TaxID=2937383 RepID=UPI00226A1B7C|nr:hypothetical protein [Sphingomonas sp. GC_Shp_3]
MAPSDVFGQLAAGLRIDLTLLAVMSLLTIGKWAPDALTDARRMTAQKLNNRAWFMLGWSVISYSPAHASWLMGHPLPHLISKAMDAVASGLACATFIQLIAYRGLMRGLTWERVRHGMRVNVGILFAVVGAAWLTR